MKHPQSIARVLALITGLVVALFLGSCTTSPESGTGTLRLKLVDSPILGTSVEAVTVTFSKIEVHKATTEESAESGWIEVVGTDKPITERTFNLLNLVGGVEALLGEKQLDVGIYTQIRVIVDHATITVDGVEQDLTIPSGQQTGVKLVQSFEIKSDEITELTLDFDVEQSVHETPPGSGKFLLTPTIRIVQTVLSGSIAGTVSPVGIGAVVNVYEAGTTNLVTSASVDPTTGAYVVKALLAGTYDIQAVANGYEVASESSVTVSAGAESGGHDFTLAIETP